MEGISGNYKMFVELFKRGWSAVLTNKNEEKFKAFFSMDLKIYKTFPMDHRKIEKCVGWILKLLILTNFNLKLIAFQDL